jgi:hypothetical protein
MSLSRLFVLQKTSIFAARLKKRKLFPVNGNIPEEVQ